MYVSTINYHLRMLFAYLKHISVSTKSLLTVTFVNTLLYSPYCQGCTDQPPGCGIVW